MAGGRDKASNGGQQRERGRMGEKEEKSNEERREGDEVVRAWSVCMPVASTGSLALGTKSPSPSPPLLFKILHPTTKSDKESAMQCPNLNARPSSILGAKLHVDNIWCCSATEF